MDTKIELVAKAIYTKEQIAFFASKKGWTPTVLDSGFDEETKEMYENTIDNPVTAEAFCVEYFRNLLTREIVSGAVDEINRQKDAEKNILIEQTTEALSQAITVEFNEI